MEGKVSNWTFIRHWEKILLLSMFLLFGVYVWFWWAMPTTWFGTNIWFGEWYEPANTDLFDGWETYYCFLAAPVILICIVGAVYLRLPRGVPSPKALRKKHEPPNVLYRFWNFIVSVRGPLGVLKLGELFWFLLLVALCAFHFFKYMDGHVDEVKLHPEEYPHSLADEMTEYGALILGWIAGIAFFALLIPVSRTSVLHRLLDVPFEAAVKYHRWVGHLTMTLIVLHSIGYVIVWSYRGEIWDEIWRWQKIEIANLPGVIATLIGVAIWITSMQYFRRKHFNLFFNVHMVYTLFILFTLWHLGDFFVVYGLPGFFLFSLDRMMRFYQSRFNNPVLATKLLPDGTVQVEVQRHPSMTFYPLQFLFVNIPFLSRLQWHPFSLESSPLDNDRSFIFHVKALGKWSERSTKVAAEIGLPEIPPKTCPPPSTTACPFSFVKAEGFHGHASNFFLEYPTLVLAAAGSGIVPFISVIRDVLNRHRIGSDVMIPTEIHLIWAVKHHVDLAPLADIYPELLCRDFDKKVQIHVKAFVTRDKAASGDLMKLEGAVVAVNPPAVVRNFTPMTDLFDKTSIWQEAFILTSSFLGVTFLLGLCISLIIHPIDKQTYEIFPRWVRGTIYLAAVLLGVFVFGSASIYLCYWYNKRKHHKDVSLSPPAQPLLAGRPDAESPAVSLLSGASVIFGTRPNLHAEILEVAKTHSGASVALLASGTTSFNEDAALACRRFNGFPLGRHTGCYVDYHSVSYEL